MAQTKQDKKPNAESDKPRHKDPDWLRREYHEKELSLREVAKKTDVSFGYIRKQMEEFDIPRRRTGYGTSPPEETLFGNGEQPPARPHTNQYGHRSLDHNVSAENRKRLMIHRLHATLLVEDIEDMAGKVVHHKNGCPFDNRLENYELLDKTEHRKLHSKTSLKDCKGMCRDCGETHYFSEEQVVNFCPTCGERYDSEEFVQTEAIDWKIPH
jgi:hypothetical protein